MKRKYCLIAALIFFTACQKGIEPFEDGGSPQTGNDLIGTWNFTSLTGNTQSIAEYTDSGIDYKTITISNYTTTNNTGTITFSDSTFNMINTSYSISSMLFGYNYQNNILIDSVQMPFTYALDSTNSSGSYKLIGTDSIYFPQGSLISVAGSATQGQPTGGRISIVGNSLTITESINEDSTKDVGGVPYHTTDSGTFDLHFQKQ